MNYKRNKKANEGVSVHVGAIGNDMAFEFTTIRQGENRLCKIHRWFLLEVVRMMVFKIAKSE